MLSFFSKEYPPEQYLRYAGSTGQLFGLRAFEFFGGRSNGVLAADIRTGAGLRYTVMPGRGMDISEAEYKGIPLCFISSTGIVSPSCFEPAGDEWMRSFTGGLLTGCGMNQVGNDCVVNGFHYPLHGRVSNTPAENVCMDEGFSDDVFRIRVKGTIRQAKPLEENLALTREVSSVAGINEIVIDDVYENRSCKSSPFMILYHFNIGFPFLSERTRFIIPHRSVESHIEGREEKLKAVMTCEPPAADYPEDVFLFDMKPDKDGSCGMLAVNDGENPELGLLIRFPFDVLPRLTLWKQFQEQDYVVGIEPCNNEVHGLKHAMESGQLRTIGPRQRIKARISLSVLEGEALFAAVEAMERKA